MKITRKKLSDLKHPEKNVRMHTDKQLAEFKRSITMFGQIRPIVVDENNVILAGNGLYSALLDMGEKEADCYVVEGLSENEKKKLMLADNKIFDLGVDDMRAFDEIIAELGDDLDVPGYDLDLLNTITLEPDDVNTAMAEYGIIDEKKRDEIKNAKSAYEKMESEFVADAKEYIPPAEPGNPSDDKLARNYITCPHCGEKIWL